MKKEIDLAQARIEAKKGLPGGSVPMWNMRHLETYARQLRQILDHGHRPIQHKAWVYDPETLVLRHKRSDYELDLEKATTAAQLLDWVLQISNKSDMQLEEMLTLLQAVGHVRGVGSLQEVFCPFGRAMPAIKW